MSYLVDALGIARRDAAAPFLATAGGSVMRYGQLDAETGRLAHALRRTGVQVGDRVAVQIDKSPEGLLLYLACVRAGAVYLPLNPAYTLAELDYFATDAEPSLMVVKPDRVSAVAARTGLQVRHLEREPVEGSLWAFAGRQPAAFADVAAGPGDLAAILYTSGTTGRSKGAMLTHANLASNALILAETWRFSADDVLLHALPIYHTHGLFVATNTVLAAGASMIFLPDFDAAEVVKALPAATVFMGVPTYYTRLLDAPGLEAALTDRMRLFVSGSAPLQADTHRLWQARTGHAILERYGMTETNMITSNPYDGRRVPGSVGTALPGVEVRITAGNEGIETDTDVTGMIEVRGPNVFAGYWRNPGKTVAEFRTDGYFVTGDLGRRDADGYVWIVGRGKDLVITGGLNVYPREVEIEIDALEGVAESAVIGLPHPDFGEAVTAVVVPDAGASVVESEVIAQLRYRLAGFKTPKRVILVEALPRNAMGKVQKALLRKTFAALYEP